MEKKTTVVVVGAGPSGLATTACLNRQNIPTILLERDDCYASLWRKRAYGRLKLHLAKEFCQLPHFPYPPNSPTFIPKATFINYLDAYVAHFGIHPIFNTQVTSATFDHGSKNWMVESVNLESGVAQRWVAKFLVVATGENCEGYVPPIPGLGSFFGEVVHSSKYVDGEKYKGRDVLVVGSGNSGVEISLDLCNWGANTSIVIRSPVHVLDEQLVRLGMTLLAYGMPIFLVDSLIVLLGRWKIGDVSDYGIRKPRDGPFLTKKTTGRSAVIDVGTMAKIRQNKIKVYPSVERVDKRNVYFTNGKKIECDAIVLATGYRSNVKSWLQDEGWLFGEDGMPKGAAAHHWKGENGLYCVGFGRNGLFGINRDATAAVADITAALNNNTPTN